MRPDAEILDLANSGIPYMLDRLTSNERDRLDVLQGKAEAPLAFLPKRGRQERRGATEPDRSLLGNLFGVALAPVARSAAPRPSGLGLRDIPAIEREALTETVKDVAAIPGLIAGGLMEGVRAGGIQRTGQTALDLFNFAFKGLQIGTEEGQAVAQGAQWLVTHPLKAAAAVKEGVKEEVKFIGEFLDDPQKIAAKHPIRTLDALAIVGGGTALITKKGLQFAGRKIATDAFERAAKVAGTQIGKKAVRLQEKAGARGVAMTEQEAIEAVIQSDPSVMVLRRAKGVVGPVTDALPLPHGMEARWMRQMNEGGGVWTQLKGVLGFHSDQALKARGKASMAFAEYRVGRNLENHLSDLVIRRNREFFKGVNADARSGMTTVMRGSDIIDGKVRHGGIARAGTLEMELIEGERLMTPMSTVLDDGRVVGPIMPENPTHQQLYRLISEEQAKFNYDSFAKKHPEHVDKLNLLMAEKETPMVTWQGERLPKLARKALKEQFNIKSPFGDPLSEESMMASALMKNAFGADAFPVGQMFQFNWVPEVPHTGTGVFTRMRNSLASFQAPTRKFKSGRAAERAITTGEDFDIRQALTSTQVGLVKEEVRNGMTRQLLSTLAEPLTAADRAVIEAGGTLAKDGFRVMSGTGMFAESAKFRGFLKRNKEFFAQHGIDIPENHLDSAVQATYLAGGKGYKIPSKIVDDLNPFWLEPSVETSSLLRTGAREVDKWVGDFTAMPLTFWLSRPSTANRNFFSQAITFAPKVLRDFYTGALQQIPGARYSELPWQNVISDFQAMGRMHGSQIRNQMPAAMMSSTFINELERGVMSRAAAKPLRLFGFNYHDVSFKRLAVESVLDANSKAAWHRAVRFGQTGDLDKTDYIRRWRAGVPPELERNAWREMDTWGAYDYDNVPWLIAAVKRSNVGRSLLPYPTWQYKQIANQYTELGLTPQGLWHNVMNVTAKGRSKEVRINAMANLMTGATMSAAGWISAGMSGSVLKGLDEDTRAMLLEQSELTGTLPSEQDLPFDVRQFGRTPLAVPGALRELFGLADDDVPWVRTSDFPYHGEAMAIRAIMGESYSFQDYMNDRVSLGPLTTFISILTGMSDDYNKNYSAPSRMGRLLADVTPFTNETKVMRRLEDTQKREITRENASFFEDLLAGWADNYPVISGFLHEETELGRADEGFGILRPRLGKVDTSVKTYNVAETLSSYFALNTKVISGRERNAVMSLMAIQQMADHDQALSEDILLKEVMSVMDARSGKTAAGEAKARVLKSDPEVKLTFQRMKNSILLRRAFRNGGAAAVELEWARIVAEDPPLGPSVPRSAKSLIRKYHILESEGLGGSLQRTIPKRLWQDYLNELDEINSQIDRGGMNLRGGNPASIPAERIEGKFPDQR